MEVIVLCPATPVAVLWGCVLANGGGRESGPPHDAMGESPFHPAGPIPLGQGSWVAHQGVGMGRMGCKPARVCALLLTCPAAHTSTMLCVSPSHGPHHKTTGPSYHAYSRHAQAQGFQLPLHCPPPHPPPQLPPQHHAASAVVLCSRTQHTGQRSKGHRGWGARQAQGQAGRSSGLRWPEGVPGRLLRADQPGAVADAAPQWVQHLTHHAS